MKFCEIPAGSAAIGSDQGEFNEKPVIKREFRGFHLGQFTVTQAQYKAVLGKEPWKQDGQVKRFVMEGENYPALFVSYDQALEFARVLTLIDPSAKYRLPTEAEFEYAARAGTVTNYYWGDDVNLSYAYFYNEDAAQFARDVTTCPERFLDQINPGYCANDFGLMHMLGNVWQWTTDAYLDSYTHAPTDGNVAVEGDTRSSRVMRGGSWVSTGHATASLRNYGAPDSYYGSHLDVGFRLVRTPR